MIAKDTKQWAIDFIKQNLTVIREGNWARLAKLLDEASQFMVHQSAVYKMLADASINIPQDLGFIPPYYMYNVYDKPKLYIPGNLSVIGASAYADNPNLEEVHIPKSVCDIDYRAFARCPNLKDIYIDRTEVDFIRNVNRSDYWLAGSDNAKLHFIDEVN